MSEGFRVSPQQRHLWASWAAEGRATGREARCVVRIEGDVDADAVHRALDAVVQRWEILRTVYRLPQGLNVPLQVVLESAPPAWEVVSGANAGEWLLNVSRPPLDPAQAPVVHAELAVPQEGASHHHLLLRVPSLAADRQGLRALVSELAGQVAADARGGGGDGSDEAGEEPLQYADLAEWLLELAGSEEAAGAAALEKRLEALSAGPRPLPFGLDRPAAAGDGAAGPVALANRCLPIALGRISDSLGRRAADLGVSSTDLLLTAWRVCLGALLETSEPPVGRVFDGRRAEDLDGLVGRFARALPLPGSLPRGAGVTFTDAVAHTVAASREVEPWQEYLQPRSPAYGFDVEEPPATHTGGGLRWDVVAEAVDGEPAVATLQGVADGGRLRLALSHDPSLLEERHAQRLADAYTTVLAAVVADPLYPLHRLPYMDRAEHDRLLVGFNTRLAPEPVDVDTAFAARAARQPDAPAVVGADGGTTSYGELDRQVSAAAGRLRARGVGPDVVVALAGRRSPDLVAALLAVLRAGGAYLPLDPALPARRLTLMLRDAGARLVLADPDLAADLDFISDDADPPPTVLTFGELLREAEDGVAGAGRAATHQHADPASLAYVMYTSGSTGRPNGVMVHRGGLASYVGWGLSSYRVEEGSGAPVHSSVGFDLTITSLLLPLAAGRTVELVDEAAPVEALAGAVAAGKGYSLVKLTPSHLEALGRLAEPPAEGAPAYLVLGGEALHGEALADWRRRCPGVRVVNEYGPTETVVGCCAHQVPAGEVTPGPVPIGLPIAGARLYVMDPHGEPQPMGVRGELWIGGAGVTRGYLGRPRLTAERFVPDPYSPQAGARAYRSGDLARHRAGVGLEYLGRVDRQVKLRGYRLEPAEIEAALRAHPAVAEVAVVVQRGAAGQERLVAWLVPAVGEELEVDDIAPWLGRRLPEYMVPAAFGGLDALPVTANGKLDRRALEERPAPDAGTGYRAPTGAAETALASIWADVLGVAEVGADDDFFQLGGDSILSIQVVARARRAGLDIAPRDLFDHRTVAALAEVASAAGEVTAVAPDDGGVPLTPSQHWFFAQRTPSPHHFNLPLLLTAGGAVDVGRLRRAAATVWGRHDALRSRFPGFARGTIPETPPAGAELLPRERPPVRPALAVADLSALPEAAWGRALERAASAVQESLDLERGGLLRALLFTPPAPAHPRLLLVAHHLVVDAVSWQVLVDELDTAYRHGADALAPRPAGVGHWSRYLEERAAFGALDAGPWLEQARHASASVVPLPGDGTAGAGRVGDAAAVTVKLDQAATARLLESGREGNANRSTEPGGVLPRLLAALAEAVNSTTGGDTAATPGLWIELEGHGREDLGGSPPDVSRTVGWLTSLYPLWLEWPTAGGPEAILEAAGRALTGVPHRGASYGVLRWSGGGAAAELAAAPSPEVLFNYLGRLGGAAAGAAADGEAAGWRRDESPAGAALAADTPRSHPLDVVAFVTGSRLRAVWRYNPARFPDGWVAAAAERFAGALARFADEPGAALSASGLSDDDLRRVLEKVRS